MNTLKKNKTNRKNKKKSLENSDKSQKKLSVANAKLANFSTKLSKYFSPEVYNSLFTGELDVKVQTQRKLLTIFFSDLEGFTELTERLEPEVLTELLTHYLTEMSKIALRWGGTIDKYIGDAIMIFFGDPASKGEKSDAVNCVRMAMEMVDQLAEVRAIWKDKGLALPLNARMGIHTGICTVGNFGSENRLDYTVIGNGVNLASRLESNAKPNSILISEDTYLHVRSEINCSKNNTIKVKGVSYPVQTYKVEGLMMEPADQFGLTEHQIPGLSLILDQSKIENRALVRKKIKEVLLSLIHI